MKDAKPQLSAKVISLDTKVKQLTVKDKAANPWIGSALLLLSQMTQQFLQTRDGEVQREGS